MFKTLKYFNQWGQTSANNTTPPTYISIPISFNSAIYTAVATGYDDPNNNSVMCISWLRSESSPKSEIGAWGFRLSRVDKTVYIVSKVYFSYVVIGK